MECALAKTGDTGRKLPVTFATKRSISDVLVAEIDPAGRHRCYQSKTRAEFMHSASLEDSSTHGLRSISGALAFAFAVSVLLAWPGQDAEAALYRCVGSDGVPEFSQSPCEDRWQPAKTERQHVESLDCRIAEGFLRREATAMKQGRSLQQALAYYGGTWELSSSALAMIDYVHSFRGNARESVVRITEQGTQRCEAGSFGRADCSVFPRSYIHSVGGCQAAMRSPGLPAAALPSQPHDGNNGRGDEAWLNSPTPETVAPGASSRRRSLP